MVNQQRSTSFFIGSSIGKITAYRNVAKTSIISTIDIIDGKFVALTKDWFMQYDRWLLLGCLPRQQETNA